MARCCLLSEENNQSVYLLICSEAEVVSVKTILMFGEATANCLQRNKTYRNGCQSIVARPYKQFTTSPRSEIYNDVNHHSQHNQ